MKLHSNGSLFRSDTTQRDATRGYLCDRSWQAFARDVEPLKHRPPSITIVYIVRPLNLTGLILAFITVTLHIVLHRFSFRFVLQRRLS